MTKIYSERQVKKIKNELIKKLIDILDFSIGCNHVQIKIFNGEIIPFRKFNKREDCRCYICKILNNAKKEIAQELK